MKISKKKRIVMIVAALLIIFGATCTFVINKIVIDSATEYILTEEQASELDADCILILGCLVWDEGRPSHILEDRLITGINLYNSNTAPKLLMSGDHGTKEYDEVNTMKAYAIDQDVPAEDIFMDHAGFSTYDSLYRARDIFSV